MVTAKPALRRAAVMGVPKFPEAGGAVSDGGQLRRGKTYAENGDFLDDSHDVFVVLSDSSVCEIRVMELELLDCSRLAVWERRE